MQKLAEAETHYKAVGTSKYYLQRHSTHFGDLDPMSLELLVGGIP